MLRSVRRDDPDDGLLEYIESRAVQWVREAGGMALGLFGHPLHVEFKAEGRLSPVTEADRGIEAFLRAAIAGEFPDHAILGEEGTEMDVAAREFVWVLDPLDGTSNFWNGLPIFACSAALLWRGEPVVGAIFLPAASLPPAALPATAGVKKRLERRPDDAAVDAVVGSHGAGLPAPADRGTDVADSRVSLRSGVIHARRRGGAHLDGVAVSASEEAVPVASHLIGLPGHHGRLFQWVDPSRRRPGEPRCLGSICFEVSMVATGVLLYAVYRRPKVWDVAAGTLIVREAGGESLYWHRDRWEPLLRFDAMANPKAPVQVGLRYWVAPTLVGGRPMAHYAAERLRPKGK